MHKNFSAMILAAGFGTRMKSLTNEVPKPLIKVNNIPLLQNSIDFLFNAGCKKLVINTHYKHSLISNFVKNNYNLSNIFLSNEKNILDTAGGVKNALHFFDDKNILIINSDIFLINANSKNIINLITNFKEKENCKLLLVEKRNAHGLINNFGDFTFINGKIRRWQNGEKILYYSGIQMINSSIFDLFNLKKFSFNEVWDNLILSNSLYGSLMTSALYHVGDIKGLKAAKKLNT